MGRSRTRKRLKNFHICAELTNNIVLKYLEKELKQINSKINSLVKNMEQCIVSVTIREILYKLENERTDIKLKIAEEKTKIDKLLNFEDMKNFISLFAAKTMMMCLSAMNSLTDLLKKEFCLMLL